MTTTINPFEQLADRQAVSPQKAKWRAAEKRSAKAPMVPTEQEKKLRDTSKQLRMYRRWKRSLLKAQLKGPHATQWVALLRLLRKLTIDDSDLLIDHVRSHWVNVDRDTQHLVLSTIGSRISRLRIQNGYEEIDDALPGEQPNAYLIIRAELLGLPLPD